MQKILTLLLLLALLLGLGGGMLLGRRQRSDSERRTLTQWPAFTWSGLYSGAFESVAQDAAADQFPFRDSFRRLKALSAYRLFQKAENNGFLLTGGAPHAIYKQEAADPKAAGQNLSVLAALNQTALEAGCKTTALLIPTKYHYYPGSRPDDGYSQLETALKEALPGAAYLPVEGLLTTEDYYCTDPHLQMRGVEAVCAALLPGSAAVEEYGSHRGFRGAYWSQCAYPLGPSDEEDLYWDESADLDGASVRDLITGQDLGLYDQAALDTADPYSFFLYGSRAVLEIRNPGAETDRSLILFRDSYGSAIGPELARTYRCVVLVDLRYISWKQLGDYVTFSGQDVLFLTSALTLASTRYK